MPGPRGNSTSLGYLFFFGTMFFVFATIGIIARLRLERKWEPLLTAGNPIALFARDRGFDFYGQSGRPVGIRFLADHRAGQYVFAVWLGRGQPRCGGGPYDPVFAGRIYSGRDDESDRALARLGSGSV